MPRLDNPRHELFAQAIAKGKSQREAYVEAGFGSESVEAQDANASRLISDDRVKLRVVELQERAANRVEVTLETQLAKLETVMNRALGSDQNSAAVAAIMGQSKLAGLIEDKVKSENKVDLATEGMSDRELARRIAMTLEMGKADRSKPVQLDLEHDALGEGEHVH